MGTKITISSNSVLTDEDIRKVMLIVAKGITRDERVGGAFYFEDKLVVYTKEGE